MTAVYTLRMRSRTLRCVPVGECFRPRLSCRVVRCQPPAHVLSSLWLEFCGRAGRRLFFFWPGGVCSSPMLQSAFRLLGEDNGDAGIRTVDHQTFVAACREAERVTWRMYVHQTYSTHTCTCTEYCWNSCFFRMVDQVPMGWVCGFDLCFRVQ
jgi:hypothetical protein